MLNSLMFISVRVSLNILIINIKYLDGDAVLVCFYIELKITPSHSKVLAILAPMLKVTIKGFLKTLIKRLAAMVVKDYLFPIPFHNSSCIADYTNSFQVSASLGNSE